MVAKDVGSESMRMWGGLMRRFRLVAGVTHEELAAFVGYSKSLVVGIERGLRMPGPLFVPKADECVRAGGVKLPRDLGHSFLRGGGVS